VFYELIYYHGQYGLLTCLCLLCPHGFSLCDSQAAVSVPKYLACLVLCTWSVITRSPFLVSIPRPHSDLLLILQPPHLPTLTMKLLFCIFHPVLLLFVIASSVFRAPPALPRRLAAMADALLSMVSIDLLLLL
jgi:hypothetical protein